MDVEAAQQIFDAGEHLEQAGKLEQAVACYQQATKLQSDNYYYQYRLGNVLRQQNKLEQATQCFRRAIAINQHDSWSYHALGEVLTQQQDFAAAIESYHQAIAINPDFSWSHYNLARLYQQQDQLELAKTYYQQAIQLKSDYFWSHYFLAEILTRLQNHQEAIAHYYRVIELNPNFFEAYYQLARHLQQQEQPEAAVKYYLQGIKLNQSHFNSYYFLSETLIQLNRYSEAVSHCEAAIKLQLDNLQPYFLLGLILLNQGNEAIANYRHVAANKSLKFQVNLELGLAQAWQRQGEISKSVECCQAAIKIDPTSEMPYLILQYIPLKPQEVEQGIVFYQQIGQKNQVSPLLWGNLGDLFTKQSCLERAVESYRKGCFQAAIKSRPELSKLDWKRPKQEAPDFILIGASKSGTTSLFFYLIQHPQILPPHKKEINFFNHNFGYGSAWYLAHFPSITDAQEYLTGEASPLYIYDIKVVYRVKQLFPNTKIIIMLRNPVTRTISEYYHAANHGLEQRSLPLIISQEKQKLLSTSSSKCLDNFGYLLNSIYIDKIVRWQTHFPLENVLIIESESFFDRTGRTMEQVWQFLDLPAIAPPKHTRYNVGSYPPVSQEIQQELKEFFQPYNQELFAYLQRQFSWQ